VAKSVGELAVVPVAAAIANAVAAATGQDIRSLPLKWAMREGRDIPKVRSIQEAPETSKVLPVSGAPKEYLAPESLEAAAEAFGSLDKPAFLAGGMDLVPLLKYGVKQPASLVSLNGFPALKQIAARQEGLFIEPALP